MLWAVVKNTQVKIVCIFQKKNNHRLFHIISRWNNFNGSQLVFKMIPIKILEKKMYNAVMDIWKLVQAALSSIWWVTFMEISAFNSLYTLFCTWIFIAMISTCESKEIFLCLFSFVIFFSVQMIKLLEN